MAQPNVYAGMSRTLLGIIIALLLNDLLDVGMVEDGRGGEHYSPVHWLLRNRSGIDALGGTGPRRVGVCPGRYGNRGKLAHCWTRSKIALGKRPKMW